MQEKIANPELVVSERVRFEEMISNYDYSNDPHSVDFEVGVLIAFRSRHNVLKATVDMLCRQTLKPAVILVASHKEDIDFAKDAFGKYENVFLCLSQNYPLGGKWSDGVKYAQKFDLKGLAILGSDDFLSLEYLEYCHELTGRGEGSRKSGCSDMLGTKTWHIYNTSKALSLWGGDKSSNELYKLNQIPSQPISLGAGRFYSKRILDILGWEIFERIFIKCLDDKGYFDMIVNGGIAHQMIEDENVSVMSLKGNWDSMNSFEKIINYRLIKNEIEENQEEYFKKYFNCTKDYFQKIC